MNEDIKPTLSASASRVQESLHALGFQNQVIEHTQPTRTAEEAAAAVGCSVGQICKSLIFRTKTSHLPLLVITSGANRVNEKQLRQLMGEAVERADADYVRQVCGFAIGGVPPVGHPQALTTLIDQDLMDFQEIWAAAGTPNAVFCLTPEELKAMTNGKVCCVKELRAA